MCVSKSFGSVRALEDVSLTVGPGSFHAVVGENGAGKSTLAKCIVGFYSADAGEIRLNGDNVRTPAEARRGGVGMVFQHFTLVPSMTVVENLVLARQDLPTILKWRDEQKRLEEFLEHSPFKIDLSSRVAHLSAGEKQKVEILKQLYLKTTVLILDEPTSALTPSESNEVMGVLSTMVRRGVLSVILITHKLREVFAFADEVTVLRRGRFVVSMPVSKTDPDALAADMMGGESIESVDDHDDRPEPGPTVLDLKGLTVRGDNGMIAVKEVSLAVRAGEILGIAGVSGNGQRELVQAIGGQRDIESGSIMVKGKPFERTRDAIREAGLLTLPEEPLQNATVPSMSVAENLALRTFDQSHRWLLNPKAIKDAAVEAIRRFSIRPPMPELPIRNLSGGNVQRTVLARDLDVASAKILVIANPCFGLDLAATAFVHNHLIEFRNNGGAVLLVSEDLDELIKLCGRIVVMSEGRIVHETSPSEIDLSVIGRYMGGHMAHIVTTNT
jgi:simple sugar transport system ATP-binding protein